jgi:protein-S-isoprenylcysteine O-methyltransferase Ste14
MSSAGRERVILKPDYIRMRQTLTIVVFFVLSMALVWISRRSLAAPRSHGFYRFFAWEVILALALLNLPVWFQEPFSWHQLISWAFLCISATLVIDGAVRLKRGGKQASDRSEAPLLDFEKTTHLVTTGIYRYIRHPMYSSLLFLAWGVFFKSPGLQGIFLAGAATGFLVKTARIEEAENLSYYGEQYREYMSKTWRFVPYIY